MNITWTRDLPFEDKEMILNKISEVENLETHSFEEFEEHTDESGGFSFIYFVGKYALKYTSFWDYDDLFLPKEKIQSYVHLSNDFLPCLQSDHEIIPLIEDHPSCVKMFGYSSNWVVLEKINCYSLMDNVILGKFPRELNNNQLIILEDFIEHCLCNAIFPVDINGGSLFPISETELKIIDFNLYQKFSDLTEFEFVPPNKDEIKSIAKKIVADLII